MTAGVTLLIGLLLKQPTQPPLQSDGPVASKKPTVIDTRITPGTGNLTTQRYDPVPATEQVNVRVASAPMTNATPSITNANALSVVPNLGAPLHIQLYSFPVAGAPQLNIR